MSNFLRYSAAMIVGGLLVAAVLLTTGAFAQEPDATQDVDANFSLDGVMLDAQFIPYQGQLLDPNASGAPVADGSYQMVFRIYNVQSGGSPLWQESKSLVVNDGLFSTLLGDVASLNLGDFNGQRLWLGVEVNGNGEMTPRQPFGAVPYAIYAENAKLLNGRESSFYGERRRDPIAYGIVRAAGGREKGWNFSSGYDSNLGGYVIEINDINYNVNEYVTMVTPVVNQSDCENAVLAASGSRDGRLIVDLEDRNGNNVQCKFHFVTFDAKRTV
jgi:hypothetical protein